MAFFGLTALGPQNSFGSAAKYARHMHIFVDEDFQECWEKIYGKGSLHGLASRIGETMKCLFHGPIGNNDNVHITKAFEEEMFGSESETISFTTFMRIMVRLRDEAVLEEQSYHGKIKPNTDFISSSLFFETVRKCGKISHVQDKQLLPLTSSQEFGWAEQKLQQPTAYRQGSEITKFAAELIKNGVY